MKDLREMWQEVWWAMAGGKKSEYDRIKATPLFEFYAIYDLWKAQLTRDLAALKARQKK